MLYNHTSKRRSLFAGGKGWLFRVFSSVGLQFTSVLIGVVMCSLYFNTPHLVYALTESVLQMPTAVPFNRGTSGGLAGHDTNGGLVTVTVSEVKLSKSASWWDTAYQYKKSLTIKNIASSTISANTPLQITVNTQSLVTAGRLQADCDDLRLVYTPDGTTHTELSRSYTVPSTSTNCSDSATTTVTFPLQADIGTGATTTSYAIYYSNASATAPSANLASGYNIGSAQATLVCPFNGTTTCLGQSGTVAPTTATGAIRYSGGKSAIQLNGYNSDFTIPAAGSLGGLTAWTVEFWAYDDNWQPGTVPSEWLMSLGGSYLHRGWGSLRWYLGFQGQGLNPTIFQGAPTNSSWNHFAISYDGSKVRTFMNGTLTNSADFTGTPYSAGSTIRFGGAVQNKWDVKLDELRVSTVARYIDNFTSPTAPFTPDTYTKTLYHFDNNGDDPRNSGKIIDASGNGNHGTITGYKYIAGLVGVDNSNNDTGAFPSQNYAGHSGVFIEEGTTNLITNPSFDHSTYNTNWGLNYFNYAGGSATFTPAMSKRNSAGPFAAGVMVQGKYSDNSNPDAVVASSGNQVNGNFYSNFDSNQGSIVMWFTPETASGSLFGSVGGGPGWEFSASYTSTGITFWSNGSFFTKSVTITPGNTYNLVLRWDANNNLNGSVKASIAVNDDISFGAGGSSSVTPANVTIGANRLLTSSANAIIEGFTVYRRPLYDGQYGIDVGNGDEINQIYNSGTGKDPTLVTGSWDVVFALPTNASTGALTTGTGNAWSHPHSSNLLYTSTTNTGGFMMNGTYTTDGFADVGTPTSVGALATSEKIFSGGYKYTSDAANEGIYRTFTATNGGDYVLRALGHSDGTCNPQIKITRADGTTEITHLNGTTTSTRTAPNVYIFTWESPAAESEQVQLINTASSGTCYWHQVEVLGNLFDNPSFETGSGDPWIPTGYVAGVFYPINAGGTYQKNSGCHTGNYCLGINNTGNHEQIYKSGFTTSAGFYYSGVWGKSSGSTISIDSPGYSRLNNGSSNWPGNAVTLTSTEGFQSKVHNYLTGEYSALGFTFWWNGTAIGYADDAFSFKLSDVSLTVTASNAANSTETSGLRVDGADTLTQPITGLSATSGVIKYKWTPRYGISVSDKFGFPDAGTHRLFVAYGNGSNYLLINRGSKTSIVLQGYFNGTFVNATWSNPTIVGGTTYNMEISYATGGNLVLKVDEVQVASASMGSNSFSAVPTTMWWGSSDGGGYTWDATISNFTSLTPTENTASNAAYAIKFGSKSVKLVNAGTLPDEYTISINPGSTATHTLSAYVYDGTSGNVGGTVSSSIAKLVFNGSAVTPSAYTDMGGGWWRLTYSAAAANQAGLYGVQALSGKTIYVDGVQLEQKAYATTYADGSLGTGYSWSGTGNNSTSVRAVANQTYSASSVNLNATTISFWVKPNFNYANASGGSWNNQNAFVNIGSGYCVNSLFVDIKANQLAGWHCGPQHETGYVAVSSANYPSVDVWSHVVVTYDSADFLKLYKNSTLLSSASTVGKALATSYGGITIGNIPQGTYADGVISDLRIFNKALTASEVAGLYQQGLQMHSSGSESGERYVSSGTYTSPVIDLGANGGWGTTPFATTQQLNNGTTSYFTRTSADNNTWSAWEAITGNSIASLARRYLQWKADMTSATNQTNTPTISGMSVRYIEDTTAPVNPSTIALGYTNVASSSATLTSGTWYNHPAPKFSWDAGDDAAAPGQSASGIASYLALFTTSASAVPASSVSDPCYIETGPTAREFVVGTTPATCVLTDDVWYLRLQTKDNSGNVSAPVTMFEYKFDDTPPNAPTSVSSTTVGYSSTNAFTFFWPTTSDVGTDQSGMSYYQYKTGASEGRFSEWNNSNEPGSPLVTEIANVEAYKQGQNVFYVRSVDVAGNVSATTTNLGVAPFYYNSDAPTAPRNVSIVPQSSVDSPSASNVFTVTWDKPASYSGEIAKYYYCVNCTPSATTMTETTNAETVNRTLTNMALATQQGKNTIYIVAEDNNVNTDSGHGNRNFDAYATAEFYTLTVAPGAPQSLNITDASNRDSSLWRLTLAWKAPTTGGTPNRYELYRSTDDTAYTNIGSTSTTVYTDADLTQAQKYYYKVLAIDNAGSSSIFSNTVSLAPEGKYTTPPVNGGIPSATAGSTTATISWSTNRTSYGTVQYGKTTSYGSAGTETTSALAHSVKLTGLSPGTSYHYRVQALDESALVGYERGDAYSADYTFTTQSAPTISEVVVTDTGLDWALVSWKSASMSTATIQYGETTTYGKTVDVSVGSGESTHSVKLINLSDSNAYHFRVRGQDVDGNDVVSDDYTFHTITFPKITAIVLNTDQEERGSAVVLGWATNVATYGSLEYQAVRIDPEYMKKSEKNLSKPAVLQAMTQEELAAIPVIASSSVQKIAQTETSVQHVERIAGLTDGTMYVFRLRGKDQYGNEAVSDPVRYVTGADTRPPQIKNLIVETPMTGSGPDARAQIIVSWETDEPAVSQILWGQGNSAEYPSATEKSADYAMKHVAVLRDLQPMTSYHLKVAVEDKTGNQTESKDTVVVTPNAQEAAFDVIIKNLEDVFGFIRL